MKKKNDDYYLGRRLWKSRPTVCLFFLPFVFSLLQNPPPPHVSRTNVHVKTRKKRIGFTPTSYRYIFHAQRIVRVSGFDGSADGGQFKSDKYVPNEVVVFRFNADRNRSDEHIRVCRKTKTNYAPRIFIARSLVTWKYRVSRKMSTVRLRTLTRFKAVGKRATAKGPPIFPS